VGDLAGLWLALRHLSVQLASLEQGHISDEKACHPASWAKEARACVDSQVATLGSCWRLPVMLLANSAALGRGKKERAW
jgi:hypothetical protein